MDGVEQRGHAGQHHGTGAPGCPRDLHHHHDELCDPAPAMTSSLAALSERAQRAREAFEDEWAPGHAQLTTEQAERLLRARDEGIHVAVRVKMTPEITGAARAAFNRDSIDTETELQVAMIAAFEAAGFEVEQ